ncbi:ThiF family adenylyltransferase [Curtobacterium sp. MCSS17_007]|uniref:ThiF family adenylyltransferase n=1 Tax=Curtobacterium sp. MCSS17_007 TaxID=2175646 RepID=UPI000DA8519F|nr:ThiF family adenylyltransferase [Curtobacterium sp. MCSS17_007]WIE75058.1 ThiF family adenylyltransferase [Curtobacterium sp. MCSS17_007]
MTGSVPDPSDLEARRRTTSRTAALQGAGQPALDALAAARVLVVGAGGLGAPVLTYLAGSGLGRVTVVDHDVVDTSNLARQTLFAAADVGRPKAECAAERVRAVDPVVEVVALAERFRPEHVDGHDVVVDAADSVEVTRAVSDACAAAGVPFVWGTALGYDGQVSVFHDAAPEPVDFHDLHPEPLPDEGSCAADGVLPALCGAVGAVMAAQVGALVAGLGEPLTGRVLTVDARRWRWTESPLRRGPGSVRPAAPAGEPPRVAPAELARWLGDDGRPVVLVDVRTEEEQATGVIPGSRAPGQATDDAELVVVCASGGRATAWARRAIADRPDDAPPVTVLDGGITAWRREGLPTTA